MKAVVTVIGKDRVGIIAAVSACLAEHDVNILDISQTILQDYFTMIMLVELDGESITVPALAEQLDAVGDRLGLQIRVQHEAIFTAMHRV
ncbi:MAG: ACT domain-containing protein [Armatimonadota bacterium]